MIVGNPHMAGISQSQSSITGSPVISAQMAIETISDISEYIVYPLFAFALRHLTGIHTQVAHPALN